MGCMYSDGACACLGDRPELLSYARQQLDLIVVHREAITRVSPVIALTPKLYRVKPPAPSASRQQHLRPVHRFSNQPRRALPKTHAIQAQT